MTTQTQLAMEEDCQCENNKTILPFQSNFARQLYENEVMRRRPPINTTSQQIESKQQNALAYTSPLIHNTPQQIAYNELKQALSYNETSSQASQYSPQQQTLQYSP